MKRKQKFLFLFILIGLFSGAIAVQKYANLKELKIGFFYESGWGVPGTKYESIVKEAVDRFEKQHPTTKVSYVEGILQDDYSEWLAEELVKGTAPDVFIVLSEDFHTLSSIGALENLDFYIKGDEDVDVTQFYKSAIDAGKKDGHQYALPFECNPTMMFVNQTLLEDNHIDIPDNDWDEELFYDISKEITKDLDGDGYYDTYGCYDYSWYDCITTNGLSAFNEDGTETIITEDDFVRCIDYVRKLYDLSDEHEVTSEDFDLGRVAFRPLTFSDYRTYTPYPWRIKKYSNFRWTCIPMPGSESGYRSSVMNTLMFGISSKSGNKKEAWEFLKLLTTDQEVQTKIFQYSAGVSPLQSVTCSKEVMDVLNKDTPGDSSIDMSILDSVMKTSVNPTYFKNYDDVFERLDRRLKDYIQSENDSTMELYQIKKTIDAQLK